MEKALAADDSDKSFKKLAREYSVNPSKSQGGETVASEGSFPDPAGPAIMEAEEGQTEGPIAVENGIEIKDFQKRYRAEVVGGTQALRVDFEDPDPEKARRIVQQVIDAYLEQFTVVDNSVQIDTLERYLESLRLVETDLVLVLEDTTELTRNEQIDRQNELIAVRQAITQVLLRLDGRASELDDLEAIQPRVISAPPVFFSPGGTPPRPLSSSVRRPLLPR